MSAAGLIQDCVRDALAAGESGSDYDLDCFVTSEVAHNQVLTRCAPVEQGGVYVGVGPCQNFTYIGALRPSFAVVIDARVDNLIEHLIFKSVFERADTPAEYLALLFSRRMSRSAPLPPGAAPLLSAFDEAPGPASEFAANLKWLLAELGERWGLPPSLIGRAKRVYTEFRGRGLGITSVSAPQLAVLDHIPDLRAVIGSATASGHNYHFLTDPVRYSYVRDMQRSHRVVPVLGNITDISAVQRVNELLARLGEDATTVYLSNMEEFLLHRYEIGAEGVAARPNPGGALSGEWGKAYERLVDSLRTLRTAPHCVLIRFYFPGTDGTFRYGEFPWLEGHVTPLRSFLARYETESPASVFGTYW